MQKILANKIAIISFIALVLLIPLNMISGKISERAAYLTQAKQSVSKSWTDEQVVLPALIVIPFEVNNKSYSLAHPNLVPAKAKTSKSVYSKFLTPKSINIQTKIDNSVRHKGIYKVPVYTAKINVSGSINSNTILAQQSAIKARFPDANFKTPYFVVSISDPRGINSIPNLKWQDKTLHFKPGTKLVQKLTGLHSLLPKFNSDETIKFSYDLDLKGMESLSFIPSGLTTKLAADSSWQHPQFIGDFLPSASSISAKGYKANWQVTSFASNIEDKVQQCNNNECQSLLSSTIGIKHIETVDIYLQSERTVKYGILFIGLTFISFFIFETLMKLPIHPIQYTLVGLANAIFYLLLISLSEHINFASAYTIATFCCIALLFFYLQPILKHNAYAYIFTAALTTLYGILFVIINMEDLALTMGALLTFSILAIVMFTTRKIDWYQVDSESLEQK